MKAVNSEGESEPLETELGVVAKNPFSEYPAQKCNFLPFYNLSYELLIFS